MVATGGGEDFAPELCARPVADRPDELARNGAETVAGGGASEGAATGCDTTRGGSGGTAEAATESCTPRTVISSGRSGADAAPSAACPTVVDSLRTVDRHTRTATTATRALPRAP